MNILKEKSTLKRRCLTREKRTTLREIGAVSQLSHSHQGTVKRKEGCVGVPMYHEYIKETKVREKYFINL
jgi:hypothetical protein